MERHDPGEHRPSTVERQLEKRKELNPTAASLLAFLHAGPMTGWELIATAQQAIGNFWSLTNSQVYRELASMAEAGLIAAHEAGPRDRRPYELTEAGRAEFRRWLHTEPGAEQIRYPLLLRIRLGEQLPAETLAGFVATHRAQHHHRLTEYTAVRSVAVEHGDPYALATLDFGIRYEQAVLDWLDSLPPEIAGRAPDQSSR